MPASETFDFDRAADDTGDGEYATSAIVVDVREIARVRFEIWDGRSDDVWLTILRNGVTTRLLVTDPEAWATAIVADGDSVTVEARVSRGNRVKGILELLE